MINKVHNINVQLLPNFKRAREITKEGLGCGGGDPCGNCSWWGAAEVEEIQGWAKCETRLTP